MNLTVINKGMSIGDINVKGVASSSILLIGDAESIINSSAFDTPPESLIVGTSEATLIPLTPR